MLRPYVIVILNVTGVSVPTVAVTVAAPAVAPAVKVIVATPCAFVTLVEEVSVPVPVATAQVTVRPAIGSPFWSRTVTAGVDPARVAVRPDCHHMNTGA